MTKNGCPVRPPLAASVSPSSKSPLFRPHMPFTRPDRSFKTTALDTLCPLDERRRFRYALRSEVVKLQG